VKSNTSLEPHNPAYSKQSSLEIGAANVCGNSTSPCETHPLRRIVVPKTENHAGQIRNINDIIALLDLV